MELQWKKIRVYEYYGNAERKLRDKAIEALNKFKNQITEVECKSFEKKEEADDSKLEKRNTPKVMMMRATPVEELEDQRLIDIERRGVSLDEEYDRLLEENEVEQQRNNQRFAERKDKEDKTDLIKASCDQILLDTRMRKR